MKDKNYAKFIIDIQADRIICVIEKELNYDYIEIKKIFYKSVTYQLLNILELDLYSKDISELVEMFKQELIMNQYLDLNIKNSTNHLQNVTIQEIKNNLKKKAFLENKKIEDVYDEFFKDPESVLIIKTLKKTTPYNC